LKEDKGKKPAVASPRKKKVDNIKLEGDGPENVRDMEKIKRGQSESNTPVMEVKKIKKE
jgi:hypothetical protein